MEAKKKKLTLKKRLTNPDEVIVPGWLSFDDSVTLWNKQNEGIPYIKYLFTNYQKQTLITAKKTT